MTVTLFTNENRKEGNCHRKKESFAAGKDLDYYRDMIQLIVNADDLGINAKRDRGILETFQRGIVTSTTVIANGRSFDTAILLAKEANLPAGVHLNLSEGTTLSGSINGLTDAGSSLPGKEALRHYLLGDNVDERGIKSEFSAQIERILQAGLTPTHIDGHQHCHAYPVTANVVTSLAKQYNIDAIRSVLPAGPAPSSIPADLHEEICLFRQTGRHTEEIWQKEAIRTTSGLWGLPQLNSLDATNLCSLLEVIPEGTWELMVHPGYPDPGGRHFESPQRQVELTALCSDEAKEVIRRRGIQLMTYGDLPCVS